MYVTIRMYLLIFATVAFFGCDDDSPDSFKHDLPIDPKELVFKKGDCLMFKLDSLTYGAAIVLDFSKDETGIWYDLIFTDYESEELPSLDLMKDRRLMGRKIQSSVHSEGFVRLLDGYCLTDSLITKAGNFRSFGNLPLKENAKMGGYGATREMTEFITAFRNAQGDRLLPPDDYRDYLKKLRKKERFRPEEYFSLDEFIQ